MVYKKTVITSRKRMRKSRRVPRPVSSVGMSCIAENYTQIGLPISNTELRFVSTGQTFINIDDILNSSLSFTKYSPLYSKCRITGVSIATSPCPGGVAYPGTPDLIIGFYPHVKSATTLFNDVLSVDNSHYSQPGVTNSQVKYWRFKNGYYEGTDGTGYGVNFSPTVINSLSGQLTVGATTTLVGQTYASCFVNLRVKVYVSFYNKIF